MKRKISALLLVCMVLGAAFLLFSCSKTTAPLYERGKEVVSLMKEMLYDDEYLKAHGYSDNYSEALDMVRNGDYSKVSVIYELEIDPSSIYNSADIELSKELETYFSDNAISSFSSMINVRSGVDSVAIAAMVCAQYSCVNTKVDESKLYLYVFDDGCPIAVSFVKGKDNSFRATGNFIMNDNFITDSPESIEASCLAFGMSDVKATKIK